MSDKQELIWVDKELAEKYKELDSDVSKAKIVNSLIRQKKFDVQDDLESLEDDLIRFKGFSLSYASEFRKAYKSQSENIENIWEDSQDPINKINARTRSIKEDIISIRKDVEDVAESIENLDIYKLDRIVELIEKYNRMTDDDKQIFNIILSNQNE